MTTDADVIIAGGGPAGALAAYHLAAGGVRVLVLEKEVFPRYKVCGAGLTHKILAQIPFDISTVLETTVRSVIFSSGFKDVFIRRSEEPLMHCTSRGLFDDFLLGKASAEGAKVQFGEQVREVRQHGSTVVVVTRDRELRAHLVIGAEGAGSAVARSAGLYRHIGPGLAWEAEVVTDPFPAGLSGTIFLDWGAFPGGYAWVFPKGDHFSIGVGGPATLSRWMMDYYKRLTRFLEEGAWKESPGEGLRITRTLSLRSWPLPVRLKRGPFHGGSVLVTGDAAGLTDPLTGEGIYYAVRSGTLAAEACLAFLNGRSTALDDYSASINRELMTELIEARRIGDLFNTVPGKIHRFVRDNDRAWRAFGKILRGERDYADVRQGFGPWRFLWGPATAVAGAVSDSRERKFRQAGFSDPQ